MEGVVARGVDGADAALVGEMEEGVYLCWGVVFERFCLRISSRSVMSYLSIEMSSSSDRAKCVEVGSTLRCVVVTIPAPRMIFGVLRLDMMTEVSYVLILKLF